MSTIPIQIEKVVFSHYFKDRDRLDNFRLLFLEAMNYSIDLQPQVFTYDELQNSEGMVKETINTGIEIKLS